MCAETFETEMAELVVVHELAQCSLLELITEYGMLSEHLAALYLKQVLLGLEYLHSKNIVHKVCNIEKKKKIEIWFGKKKNRNFIEIIEKEIEF